MNELATILTKSQMSGSDIQQVILMIDQGSANSIYRRCAEEFGFKIAELEGLFYSTAAELCHPLGYSQPRNISNVLRRNNLETVSSRQFDASKIQAEFNLDRKDHSTRLIDYRGFLTIALEGQGPACDKVRQYLLAMEQKARVDTVIYENTGFNTDDFQDVGKYADDPTIQTMLESQKAMMASQKTMKELVKLRVRQIETEEDVKQLKVDQKKVSDKQGNYEMQLPLTSDQEHILNRKKDELVILQSQNGMNLKQAYGRFYNNIRNRFHIGFFRGMEREKFPLAVEYVDDLIAAEKAKQAQLHLQI